MRVEVPAGTLDVMQESSPGRREKPLVEELEEDPRTSGELAAARLASTVGALMEQVGEATSESVEDIAAVMSVSAERVTQILAGDGNVRIATLARFLHACGYELELTARPVNAAIEQWAEQKREGDRRELAERRRPSHLDREKRGGYGSSSKPASQLATPPRGPAPGASPHQNETPLPPPTSSDLL